MRMPVKLGDMQPDAGEDSSSIRAAALGETRRTAAR